MRSSGFRLLDRLRMRWRSLGRRGELEQELTDELHFHQAALIEQYQRQGLGLAEVRRRTRLELGGSAQISEEARDQRGWRQLDQLAADTRYAFRAFRKQPGFALTAVLTIGLGMGANTSLFTIMHAVLFRPLPVSDPGALRDVYIETRGLRSRSSYVSAAFVSFREFQQISAGTTTGEIAGIAEAEVSWRGLVGRSVRAQLVSDNLLPLIGARPILGRFFARDETANPGSAPVVVLSHALWQRELGGARDIVGRSITVNRTPFTVVGVADDRTRGPLIQTADIWIPLTMQRLTRPGESLVDDPNAAWIQLFARTHRGISVRRGARADSVASIPSGAPASCDRLEHRPRPGGCRRPFDSGRALRPQSVRSGGDRHRDRRGHGGVGAGVLGSREASDVGAAWLATAGRLRRRRRQEALDRGGSDARSLAPVAG